jgi:hypothetical protein
MPLDRRVVEGALKAKGFVRHEGDHAFFIYYSLDGKKTPVRTKTSHGSGHKESRILKVADMDGHVVWECRAQPASSTL